jgi:iron complex transport system substrate-binding protein
MLADALFLFPEASDRLVAIGKTAQWKSDFAPFVDPRFAEKTILETEAGPEQIAAMQPDLVILKSFMAEKLGAPLESIGIPVIYVDFEKPEQYPRDIDILGQVLQDGLRARQVGTFYKNQLDRVKQALAGLKEDQKPGILTLYYSEKDGQVAFNVPPVPFIQTWMAMIAGAKPLWQDIELGNGWTKVNFEQIAAWDAEQIFIVAYTSDATRVVAELKNNPQWQSLRAVKNGKLFAFPADFYSWDQPDTRWTLGLIWMAYTLHPGQFPGLDMKQEVENFYRELYNLSNQTVQETILPMLQGELR